MSLLHLTKITATIHTLRFHYRIMRMDFLIRLMGTLPSKQNRSRKLHRTAPSQFSFELCDRWKWVLQLNRMKPFAPEAEISICGG